MEKYLKNKRIYLGAVIFLFIAAFFLRIYQISRFDLWRDEAFTVTLASKNLSDFLNIALKDTSSFGHNFFVFLWTRLFGTSELSVRIPSLLFSMATFIYIFLISKKCFKRLGTILILLLYTINIVSIYYSQEARGYSMLMFLTTASFYYFIQILEKFKLKNAVLFILLTALSFYTHNLSIFTIAAYFIYTVIIKILTQIDLHDIKGSLTKSKDILKKWFILYISLFIVILPWLIVFISQSGSIKDNFWLTFDPINSSNESLTGLSVGIRLFSSEDFTIFDATLNILTLAFLFIGSVYEILKFKKLKIHSVYFFWSIFFMVYFGSFITPMLYVRYISFLIPFMIFLIYRGISVLTKIVSIKLLILLTIIMLNVNTYVSYQRNDYIKPYYSDLANYIEDNYHENDGILHLNALSFYSFEYYSHNKISTIYDPDYRTPFYTGKTMMREEDFTRDLSSLTKFDRLWIIELGSSDDRSGFETYFTLTEKIEFKGGLNLELWENASLLYKFAFCEN